MDQAQIYAWIFLSVPDHPASLQEIVATADDINHAIPTQHELRQSFGWLQRHNLIRKEAKSYSLTEAGITLRAHSSAAAMMRTWHIVAASFAALPTDDAEPDDVSAADVATAYKNYKRWFWQAYKKLKANDQQA